MRKKGYIVAIDGPAGAGKSTVSRQLAEAVKGKLLDTGSMYRSVAYFGLKENFSKEKDFAKVARQLKFTADKETGDLLVNGEHLGQTIRTEKISKMASSVSAFPKVRTTLTKKQRSLAKKMANRFPVIVEGRDIGTVVFPDVEFKFFVTADSKVRAKRRYQQLKNNGTKGISLKKILEEIEDRDFNDKSRKVAPLRCPDDAVIVDTSKMGIQQVVKFLCSHIEAKIAIAKENL